jgi:hypothetical protein
VSFWPNTESTNFAAGATNARASDARKPIRISEGRLTHPRMFGAFGNIQLDVYGVKAGRGSDSIVGKIGAAGGASNARAGIGTSGFPSRQSGTLL